MPRTSTGAKLPLIVTLVAIGCFSPSIVRAQSEGAPTNADELFERGKELLRAGDWSEACEKFRASMQLDPAVGTLLKIAKCHEHEGKLTLARADFHDALALNRTKANQTEQRRAQLEEFTQAALADLEQHIPKLRVRTVAAPPGLHITAGGAPLPPGAVDGEPVPTDPGPLEVVAEAPGYQTARFSLEQHESSTTEILVSLVPDPANVTPPAESRPAPPTTEAPPASSARRPIGFVVTGVGVVGLAVAAALGLETISKVNAASSAGGGCTSDYHCNQHGADTLGDARTTQNEAFVALGIGAAAAGAGIYLVATAPSSAQKSPAATSMMFGVSGRGAFLRGAF